MKTAYFTFGQCHFHKINNQIFDKDIVVKITSHDPRLVMFELFGSKWSMQYDDPPDMKLYPRGIIDMSNA